LCSLKGDINSVIWSPDGERLRLEVSESLNQHQFYEVSVDGKNLHPLLEGWHNPPDECCGRWTVDGKYFLFESGGQIWALSKAGLWDSRPQPIQLTSSPVSLSSPLPGRDGRKLYVIGQIYRGELMRYDMKSSQFTPFLAAISAEYADFSKSGEWVAYVSYPEGALWRSKVDGSERMQLTYPPMYPMLPRWSPDGKRIVFFQYGQNSKPTRIYEISPEGGSPRELIPDDPGQQADPNWSPDGSKLVFAGNASDAGSAIRVLDLATSKLSTLPGSYGMFSPRWSPKGRYISAYSADSAHLLLFDLQANQWNELAQGSFGWLNWSKDGQYVYLLDQSGKGAVIRVRIRDHTKESVVDLTKFKTTGRYRGSLALTPDDSPLLLREAGTQDIYALDWANP
jgi:Tol biopolymer transport system component